VTGERQTAAQFARATATAPEPLCDEVALRRMVGLSSQQPISPRSVVEVPAHVVLRAFAEETIMLNLQTGTYHGLNPTATRMLETLRDGRVIADGAAAIAARYDADPTMVQADMLAFCERLIERGLLTVKTDAQLD
jgi:hypothetical protein